MVFLFAEFSESSYENEWLIILKALNKLSISTQHTQNHNMSVDMCVMYGMDHLKDVQHR